MKRIVVPAFALVMLSSPLSAQEERGLNLMEEGARLFFEGLMGEMDPALKELEGMAQDLGPFLNDFVSEMGPALKDLMAKVEDWSVYHPPEILPNGDILIRRKSEEELAEEAETADPIDL